MTDLAVIRWIYNQETSETQTYLHKPTISIRW